MSVEMTLYTPRLGQPEEIPMALKRTKPADEAPAQPRGGMKKRRPPVRVSIQPAARGVIIGPPSPGMRRYCFEMCEMGQPAGIPVCYWICVDLPDRGPAAASIKPLTRKQRITNTRPIIVRGSARRAD
jgi:hypothetical protein